ncbi:MAG: hypothetical protein ABJF10_29460 [Chthoniobacter sp.]|uniref:hypothetical protein n=1 Tax=Chthoniobacter sp. TaxID=2510640 RepID=UPI0032A39445
MSAQPTDDPPPLRKMSASYREFLLERNEILRHKWIESEKAGCDIGFEKALLEWVIRHRSAWLRERRPLVELPREYRRGSLV